VDIEAVVSQVTAIPTTDAARSIVMGTI